MKYNNPLQLRCNSTTAEMWILRADRKVTFMNTELNTRVWLGGSAPSIVQTRSRPKWLLLPAWTTDNVLWAVDSNHVFKPWKQKKRHKSWQRTHSSSNMALISWCTKGLNVSTYGAIYLEKWLQCGLQPWMYTTLVLCMIWVKYICESDFPVRPRM